MIWYKTGIYFNGKNSVSEILVQRNLSLDFVIKCVHDYIYVLQLVT